MKDRKKPAHGVRIDLYHPTIVFVTACTYNRQRWLATEENHRILLDVWNQARAWIVGSYVLMPDHLHLFAAPGTPDVPLDNWVRFWKSQFTKIHRNPIQRWQADHWDTRLRSGENYEEKSWYVRNNPVRAGLVSLAEEWPYQGELSRLEW